MMTAVVVRIGVALDGGRAVPIVCLSSYAARLAMALYRLGQHSIYGLMEGKDAYRFWQIGMGYYRGAQSSPSFGYSRALRAEFHVFGTNCLCAMLVN